MNSNICCLIDLELFQHKDYKIYRELGICDVELSDIRNYQVYPSNLPLLYKSYRKTFNFVKFNIHGLNFFPDRDKSILPDQVDSIVINFYNKHKKNNDSVIAYKGGIHEKDLLKKLEIPSLNLENIPNCPSTKYLSSLHPACRYYCNSHVNSKFGFRHCSTIEVVYYSLWLNQN